MRILRLLLGIFVILLILAILASLIFGGSDSDKQESSQKATLSSFTGAASTDATVTFLTDGAINSEQNHRQVQITISRSAAIMTVFQGYQGLVLKTQSFGNNEQAYKAFLGAIFVAGFTLERSDAPDISGQCPLGQRYIYSSVDIANVPNDLWTSSCGTKTGSFGGNSSLINQLFQMQIPNYSTFMSGVSLS